MFRTRLFDFARTQKPTFEQLHMRLERLERSEIERAAEHMAALDRLERLYKRISMRIAREKTVEDAPESTNATRESPLHLRQRLRG